MYEDGDMEELELQEVEALLVSEADIPPDIIASLKGILKAFLENGVTSSMDEEEDDEEEEEEEESEVVGGVVVGETFVLKSFGDLGDFNGLIISHDKPFFKVSTAGE